MVGRAGCVQSVHHVASEDRVGDVDRVQTKSQGAAHGRTIYIGRDGINRYSINVCPIWDEY